MLKEHRGASTPNSYLQTVLKRLLHLNGLEGLDNTLEHCALSDLLVSHNLHLLPFIIDLNVLVWKVEEEDLFFPLPLPYIYIILYFFIKIKKEVLHRDWKSYP